MGADPGPHARTPGHQRQGDHGQPAHAAEGDRDGAGRRHRRRWRWRDADARPHTMHGPGHGRLASRRAGALAHLVARAGRRPRTRAARTCAAGTRRMAPSRRATAPGMTLVRRALRRPRRRARSRRCEARRAAIRDERHRAACASPGATCTASLRGKTLVAGAGADALRDGVGMVSTLMLKDTSDRTAYKVFEPGGTDGAAGFGFANNLLLLPDPASFRRAAVGRPAPAGCSASRGSTTARRSSSTRGACCSARSQRLRAAGLRPALRARGRVPHLPHRRRRRAVARSEAGRLAGRAAAR